jgi:hypothetical protein
MLGELTPEQINAVLLNEVVDRAMARAARISCLSPMCSMAKRSTHTAPTDSRSG